MGRMGFRRLRLFGRERLYGGGCNAAHEFSQTHPLQSRRPASEGGLGLGADYRRRKMQGCNLPKADLGDTKPGHLILQTDEPRSLETPS